MYSLSRRVASQLLPVTVVLFGCGSTDFWILLTSRSIYLHGLNLRLCCERIHGFTTKYVQLRRNTYRKFQVTRPDMYTHPELQAARRQRGENIAEPGTQGYYETTKATMFSIKRPLHLIIFVHSLNARQKPVLQRGSELTEKYMRRACV